MNASTVYLVDDDPSMRSALTRLIRTAGMQPQAFASAREFLNSGVVERPSCLVLDIHLPGLSGLELQEEMARRKLSLPIIFITGQGDVPMSVRAMKAGAVEFLLKPFIHADLLAAIRQALERDSQTGAAERERDELLGRLRKLTPREREVFDLVIKGLLNKQIAGELGAAEQTVKVHRARIMQKLDVRSVAELVQIAVKCGVAPG